MSATPTIRPSDDAPTNKHELAYRLIRERIEAAVYQPGQRLVIDALARDLNMSQVPIREAIRRLQAEGWITYRHNSGPEVANIGVEQWQATMEVLAVLEGYATALAAPRRWAPTTCCCCEQHAAGDAARHGAVRSAALQRQQSRIP